MYVSKRSNGKERKGKEKKKMLFIELEPTIPAFKADVLIQLDYKRRPIFT